MILVYMVSMISGLMGPRASKNAFTMYTAIAGAGVKKNVHFGPILDFGPILYSYGDFGHFHFEFE